MTTRVAIYARHSTDRQATSTKDQIARCEEFCRHVGYEVALIFQDEAISGASVVNRPGISELIDAAVGGYFDRVISESLSRISRDQGDMAIFFRKMRFLDIALETVSEGEINELHIGFKGTMNALHLRDLADMTRRGMIASVLKGAIPGGRTYGYDLDHRLDDRQELIKGLRRINLEQADTVRWIFARYATGATLQKICIDLNRQGISAPKGGRWVRTTLIGQVARKTGLLRQTLYKGVVTFNRLMYRKNPDTGKRQSFIRPESDWIQVPVPELAILDEKLFDQVQGMIEERSNLYKQRKLLNQVLPAPDKLTKARTRERQAAKRKGKTRKSCLYIFSGKLWCAQHHTAISVIRKRVYNCSQKACRQRNVKHKVFMQAALKATSRMTAEQIRAALSKQRHIRDELEAEIHALEANLDRARQDIRNLLDLLAKRPVTMETTEYLDDREADILKIKYEIDKLKKQHAPVAMLPDEEMDALLKRFHDAVAPLRHDDADQAATAKVYAWFNRFAITTDGDAVTIDITYDWPVLLKALRKQKSEPFLSHRPAVILHHT